MDWSTRRDLLAQGMTVREIAAAVHRGDIVRVRRGIYCDPDVDPATQRAVRVGGRLSCVSQLRRLGVWVLDDGRVHVQLAPNASRLRHPDDRTIRQTGHPDCRLHWQPLRVGRAPSMAAVSTADALIVAAGCLRPREAIASIDSALHQGLVTRRALDLAARDGHLPARLVEASDRRAESGIESIVRLLVEELGLRVQIQVKFAGVGRVDLVVEDWVVVETDGGEFHDTPVTTRDRRRDAGLAARGRTVLHFRYAQVIFELPTVATAIIEAVAMHRRVRNSGAKAAKARSRLRWVEFS